MTNWQHIYSRTIVIASTRKTSNYLFSPKMQVLFAVAAIFLAILSPALAAEGGGGSAESDGSCKNPVPVEGFASSFYTAMIVFNDPNVVDRASLPAGEASMLFYTALKGVLESYKLCNAEEVAFSGARAFTLSGKPFDLPTFFNNVANSVGKVLSNNGILTTCDNDVNLSLELYGYYKKSFKNLDPSKIESYMKSICEGVVELYVAHGLKLETTTQQTSDAFDAAYEDPAAKKCKFDEDSS